MLVALSTMTVTSVMVVMLKKVMTYPVTCQFTGTWRIHLEELPQTAFVLSLFRISDSYYKYLHFLFFLFFIFLSYFFFIHGHPPHFKRYVLMWVFYWVSDNSISWICVKFLTVFLRFSCKISFPRMLCCEASIIKCGLITDHQSFCHILSQNSEPEISLLLLSASS